MLRLALTALPRRDKQVLAAWMDALTRGSLGPITESMAELQVAILRLPIESIHDLGEHAARALARDQPEHVGTILMRTVTALGSALDPRREID